MGVADMSEIGRTTQVIRALYQFFGGFGLSAYAEDSVPTEAAPPYITVQLIVPQALAPTQGFYVRVWDRSWSFERLAATVDAIDAAIGAGAVVPTEGGAVWIYKDDPFMQYMPFPGDDTLKCAYLRMKINAIV